MPRAYNIYYRYDTSWILLLDAHDRVQPISTLAHTAEEKERE